MDQTRKFWYLLLYNFWLLDTKTHLCWREWELGCIPNNFDISLIFLFPIILSRESFNNLWGSSQITFLILDIKSCFVFGESKQNQNIANYQNMNIMILFCNFTSLTITWISECGPILTKYLFFCKDLSKQPPPAKVRSCLMPIFDLHQTWKIVLTEICSIRIFSATFFVYICIKRLRKALKLLNMLKNWSLNTAQKMKFSIKDFFAKSNLH